MDTPQVRLRLPDGRVPELVPEFRPGAPALVWSTSEGWMIQLGSAPPDRVLPGRQWSIGDLVLDARLLSLDQAGAASTQGRPGLEPRLEIVARYATVHLHRGRREAAVIDGHSARILCELAAMGQLVDWAVVAGEIWPDERDRGRLRHSWDRALGRLCDRLRELGVRENLVRSDGKGNVELFLLPGDTLREDG